MYLSKMWDGGMGMLSSTDVSINHNIRYVSTNKTTGIIRVRLIPTPPELPEPDTDVNFVKSYGGVPSEN